MRGVLGESMKKLPGVTSKAIPAHIEDSTTEENHRVTAHDHPVQPHGINHPTSVFLPFLESTVGLRNHSGCWELLESPNYRLCP